MGEQPNCVETLSLWPLSGRFGGETEDLSCMNDTWSFHFPSNEWRKLTCIGDIPSPRHRHAATMIGDIMYVYGGKAMNESILDDFYALNLTNKFLSHSR